MSALETVGQRYAALWTKQCRPKILFVGQRVRVFRWQAGTGGRPHPNNDAAGYTGPGHVEEGVISEITVAQFGARKQPISVAAVDLRTERSDWKYKRERPAVSILMRGNRYWLNAYVVEVLDPTQSCGWPPGL